MSDADPIETSTHVSYHDNNASGNSRSHYGNAINNYAAGTSYNEFRDLLRWLDAPDASTDHYEAMRRFQLGTGAWFLESQEFGDWLVGKVQILWLDGPAGCCKTTIYSAAIERAMARCETGCKVVYFYFTFRDARKQTYHGFLSSIVSQLLDRDCIPEKLQKAKDRDQRHFKPLELALVELLARYPTTHLMMDGLDECPQDDGSRDIIMQGLESLMKQCPNLKVMVASRAESDIQDFFSLESKSFQNFAIDAMSVDKDIKLYVDREIERHVKLRRLPQETKRLISSDLTMKAGGMFRWADCQLDSLKRLQVMRPQNVQEVLQSLPRTLDETYDQILLRLGHNEEVLTVLRMLTFSDRVLTLAELQEACVTRHDLEPFVDVPSRAAAVQLISDMSSLLRFEDEHVGSSFNGRTRDRVHKVLFSASLSGNTPRTGRDGSSVGDHDEVLKGDSGIIFVSFAHLSVRQYLTSTHIQTGPAGAFHLQDDLSYHQLAQTCIAYLDHLEVEWQGIAVTGAASGDRSDTLETHIKDMVETLATRFPLTRFAVQSFPDFQRKAKGTSSTNRNTELRSMFLRANTTPDLLRCLWLYWI